MIASQKRISRKAKLISQVRAIRKNNPAVDEPCFEKDSEVKKNIGSVCFVAWTLPRGSLGAHATHF